MLEIVPAQQRSNSEEVKNEKGEEEQGGAMSKRRKPAAAAPKQEGTSGSSAQVGAIVWLLASSLLPMASSLLSVTSTVIALAAAIAATLTAKRISIRLPGTRWISVSVVDLRFQGSVAAVCANARMIHATARGFTVLNDAGVKNTATT